MLRDHAWEISLQLVDCDFGMRRRPRHISQPKSNLNLVLHGHPGHFLHRGGCEFAVHAADEGGGDAGGAYGFAGVVVRAVAEAFLVHLANHAEDSAVGFGLALGQESEMGDLGAHEEHGRTIWAGGRTSATTDAGGGIHRFVGDGL